MPEAAMNEYADPVARKHYIGSPWKLPRMQAIPEAMSVQQLPDLHLRGCIAAADAGHHARPDFFADYVHEPTPDAPATAAGYNL